jgi:hypothetical protein
MPKCFPIVSHPGVIISWAYSFAIQTCSLCMTEADYAPRTPACFAFLRAVDQFTVRIKKNPPDAHRVDKSKSEGLYCGSTVDDKARDKAYINALAQQNGAKEKKSTQRDPKRTEAKAGYFSLFKFFFGSLQSPFYRKGRRRIGLWGKDHPEWR